MKCSVLRRALKQRHTLQGAATKLRCSIANIRYWAAKFGISTARPLRKRPKCRSCGSDTTDRHKDNDYCSPRCYREFVYRGFIKRWLRGEEDGTRGQSIANPIRRYLYEKNKSKCEKCGWGVVNPTTGKVPLTVNHKNGKWRDSSPRNLELICPNCHSLTPNYGALNKGNGRPRRPNMRV